MVTVKMNKSKFQKFCVLYKARGGTQKVKKTEKMHHGTHQTSV
jgi:hypothetical protein